MSISLAKKVAKFSDLWNVTNKGVIFVKSDYKCTAVAENVRREFDKRGLKPSPTMKKIGLGENTLRNFQTSMPKADTLAKIADYLDVSVDYLLGRDRALSVSAPAGNGKQRQLLALFAQLSDEGQDALIENAKTLLRLEEPKEKAADFV